MFQNRQARSKSLDCQLEKRTKQRKGAESVKEQALKDKTEEKNTAHEDGLEKTVKVSAIASVSFLSNINQIFCSYTPTQSQRVVKETRMSSRRLKQFFSLDGKKKRSQNQVELQRQQSPRRQSRCSKKVFLKWKQRQSFQSSTSSTTQP